MLAQDRYLKILNILSHNNSVKVSNLTKLFDVSIETVRRDLEYMEGQGLLKRVHGGAVLTSNNTVQTSRDIRQTELITQKTEIGEIVCDYLKEGDSIAMDASTTNHIIAKVLKTRFTRLTVLTNYLPIINELADMQNYTVIIPGGILNIDEHSITGEMANENIKKFCVNKMLLSMSGISLKDGLTDFGFNESSVKKQMISISQEIIVVAGSNKFGKASLFKVCDFNDINMIVTDSGLNDKLKLNFIDEGIEIINSRKST